MNEQFRKSQLHRDGLTAEEKPFAMTDVWGLFTVQIFRALRRGRFPGCLKELYPHSWEAESRKRWSLGWSSSWNIFSMKEWAALGPGAFRGLWVGGPRGSLGIQNLSPVDNHTVLHLNLGSVWTNGNINPGTNCLHTKPEKSGLCCLVDELLRVLHPVLSDRNFGL